MLAVLSLLRVLEGDTGPLYCCAVFPDSSRIVTGSSDGTARLWSSYGALLRTLECHTFSVFCCAVFPDSSRIVTGGGDRAVRLWGSRVEEDSAEAVLGA